MQSSFCFFQTHLQIIKHICNYFLGGRKHAKTANWCIIKNCFKDNILHCILYSTCFKCIFKCWYQPNCLATFITLVAFYFRLKCMLTLLDVLWLWTDKSGFLFAGSTSCIACTVSSRVLCQWNGHFQKKNPMLLLKLYWSWMVLCHNSDLTAVLLQLKCLCFVMVGKYSTLFFWWCDLKNTLVCKKQQCRNKCLDEILRILGSLLITKVDALASAQTVSI